MHDFQKIQFLEIVGGSNLISNVSLEVKTNTHNENEETTTKWAAVWTMHI